MAQWLLVLVGYIIGACPTAYLFGQRLKGKDIRELGDGNMGARNAYFELGHKTGILIFSLIPPRAAWRCCFVSYFMFRKYITLTTALPRWPGITGRFFWVPGRTGRGDNHRDIADAAAGLGVNRGGPGDGGFVNPARNVNFRPARCCLLFCFSSTGGGTCRGLCCFTRMRCRGGRADALSHVSGVRVDGCNGGI